MRATLHTPRLQATRLLFAGMLLLAQLLGVAGLHDGHALSSSLREEIRGATVQPSACHPHQAVHMEAAGTERHVHPCTACLHLLRSLGAERAAAPGLAAPDPVPATASNEPLPGAWRVRGPSGSRAPPSIA